jgi:hypothetical protein
MLRLRLQCASRRARHWASRPRLHERTSPWTNQSLSRSRKRANNTRRSNRTEDFLEGHRAQAESRPATGLHGQVRIGIAALDAWTKRLRKLKFAGRAQNDGTHGTTILYAL